MLTVIGSIILGKHVTWENSSPQHYCGKSSSASLNLFIYRRGIINAIPQPPRNIEELKGGTWVQSTFTISTFSRTKVLLVLDKTWGKAFEGTGNSPGS